jgi:ATP/ADP translocase/CRP-like cAMP-binding protein/HEAT repeat protein
MATGLLMFLYSFLAMTSYNIIQPVVRSKYISDMGAENLPYIQFAAGVIIGILMQGYVKATSVLPRRWVIPVSQAGLVAILVAFWLLFQTRQEWASVAFYLLGLIFAILMVSQFWTLANAIYDPRQAKRIFGFIGGGTSLGGMTGAGITALIAEPLGTNALILFSAAFMALCIGIVVWVLRREGHVIAGAGADEEKGVGAGEALKLFVNSRQVQLIAIIISFGALGAVILDQQLSMATQEFKGRGQTDAITAFLGTIRFYVSAAGFVIQVFLTSRIHRLLGIGFALMVLPVNIAAMAGIILGNYALWAPSLGSVVDRSFRYTVDKTTREILFLPLPTDVKLRAKPFIDVTVDRLAKGIGALMLLVFIKPWGLGLTWQQLSYVSLALVVIWFVATVYAKREYVRAFRRSLEQQVVEPSTLRLSDPDPSSIETLVSELAHPEPRHVLYAIDLLDAMDKRRLVTPLLLSHDSAAIRARALRVAETAGPDLADRWLPGVERALTDPDSAVRIAAVSALAALRGQDSIDVMRPFVTRNDPALAIVAAAALAGSSDPADVAAAEETLRKFSSDTREPGAEWRLQVARALGDVKHPGFRSMLVPLMYDANLDVAKAAIESAGTLGAGDFLFVPPLVSLLRNRRLKSGARSVLVGYGEAVIAPLAYFMSDREEDVWIRRHVPSTLALLPYPASIDALTVALDDPDGFLRFKAMMALDRLRRNHPELVINPTIVSRHINAEAGRAFSALTLHYNLFVAGGLDKGCLLARALTEKHARAVNRTFNLLGLIKSQSDVAAVRNALKDPDVRVRSRGIEYLDNLLEGEVRKRILLLVDEMPADERIRKGNVIYRTRTRDVEDTVAQLLHDEDQSIASAAVQLVEERGMWSLADDLEHVLAHRDVRDQDVFEAASWALAANRVKVERRKQLWQEPLPAVELADRLRKVPLFDFTNVNELFRLARLGRQVRYEQGRAVYERGELAASIQFLLDGRVTVARAIGTIEVAAPAALGFEELLEGSPMASTVTAAERSITLSLTADEFLALLSENVELAEGIFRMLIATHHLDTGHTLLHGNLSSAARSVSQPGADLRPVDRLLLLQSSPLLAHATAAQLWRLSEIARDATVAANAEALPKGEAAILIVLSGSLKVAVAEGAGTATAGDVVGLYETLAGTGLSAAVTATTETRLLRIDRGGLFELLADHTDLLQGIFSMLLRSTPARASGDRRSGSVISNTVSTP